MSLLNKLLGKNQEPRKRVHICVECGMPVQEHKDWCSIYRGRKELEARGVMLAAPETSGQ